MTNTREKFYLGVIAVLSLLLFISFAFSKSKECKRTHCDELKDFKPIEVTRIDSVEVVKKDSSSWHQPKQIKKSSKEAQKEPKIILNDSSISLEPESVWNGLKSSSRDSIALADFWTLREYSDTNHIQDAEVIVQNSVLAGRLASQRVLLNQKEKTVTVEKTVTKVIREEPKGQLFLGILAQGNKTDLLSGFGGQMIWKTKREKLWTGAVIFTPSGQKIYQISGAFSLFK